jgi:hypothetical protein
MANYLLLRNNKESGPYSADDLVNLGLKAYDLLWVQGKSAAWRYPSEIEELKSFAPVVEEQPFDRFYKKSETITEEKKADTAIAQSSQVIESKKEQISESRFEKPVVEPQYEKYIPKRSVAVTLPGQKNVTVQQPVKPAEVRTAMQETAQQQPTITISENPAAAQIKYSQPLDEIKEMYVKTLQDRKQKIARKNFWLQNLKKVAAVLSLVVVGLVAGFLLKSNKGKQAMIAQVEKPSQSQVLNNEPANLNETASKPSTDTTSSPATTEVTKKSEQEVAQAHQPNGGYVNKLTERKRNFEPAVTDDILVMKEKPLLVPETKQEKTYLPQGIETDPRTGERSRKVRSVADEPVNDNDNHANRVNTAGSSMKKNSIPEDISRLVSVKSNEYKRVAFGGIRDLQLTVVNDSKFILDNVTAELQYIKPNELPLKTENIQFTSVAPNATSTIRVPDTNRGIKVVFRITNIRKKQADERVADN